MKEMWNQRYQGDDYYYGLEPNEFFKAFIDQQKPGRIFLPGEGEGRNAVYAASKGWEVTALDYSEEARTKALTLASKQQVSIHYEVSPIEEYQIQAHNFDAIACIFLHLPPDVQLKIYSQLINGLKPGGQLFLTGFTKDQLNYNSGGPKNSEWLFSAATLEKEFADLHIIRNHESLTMLHEGEFHEGEAAIVEFIAKKPE